MAIAFAHVSIHSRAKGHSSVAGAAYRAGVNLYNERTGETHDFSSRSDVAYASLVLPDGANPTFADREKFWNTVEFFEKRGDAQVAKDYVLALPKELSIDENITLARNFAFTYFVSEGLVADISIHDHGDGNPHAHIYVPTRRVLEHSLSPTKARDLNPRFAASKGGKGFVSENEAWGEKWRDYQNQYFKSKGIDLEVDENYIFSQRHEGNIRSEAHYLKEENALRRQASIEVALSSPESVINMLATKYPTFNEKRIENFVAKNTDTAEQKEAALAAVMSHSELVYLGIGEDGRRTYTSQGNFLKEAEVAQSCETLAAQQNDAIQPESLNATIAAFSLNSEQADALQVICSGKQLVCVVGRAGTGKSYMLRAANQVFENAGQRVYGMAISGIAAQGLSEAGIASNTIAHYRKRIQHDNWQLKQGDVVIMDEAGMTGLHDMHEIVRHVKASGAKLVLVGDYDQLQPINSAPTFKAIVERTGFCELSQIMRQEKAGDRQASTWLSQQKVDCALAYYHEQGDIHFSRTQIDADNQLVRDWFAALDNRPTSQIILAHTNAHVETLNHLVRTRLMTAGLLAEDLQTRYQTSQGEISLSVGDRVLLKRNDSSLGVKNGQLATVKACEDGKLTLILDAEQRIVQINTAEYQDFYYGYATTIHKSQGATFDKVFVAAQGAGWDRYLSYVALSRHKKQVKLYASHESYQSIAEMTKAFSKRTLLDSALNYPLMYGIRRGFEADGLVARFLAKIGLAKQKMVDAWQQVRGFEKTQTEVDGKKPVYAYQVAAQQAKNIRAIKVASFADLHREVGKGWADLRSGTKNEKAKATAQNTPLNPPFELLEKMVAKNQLGAEIYAQYQEFETACTLNFVKIETLAQCHQKTQALNLLTQYIDAYQQGKTSHQLQIARKLEKLNTGYYSELSYLALKKQLDVKTLYSHIKQSQQKAQDYAVISASDMHDKPVLRAALAYMQAEERRKAAVS